MIVFPINPAKVTNLSNSYCNKNLGEPQLTGLKNRGRFFGTIPSGTKDVVIMVHQW